jgi:hypothetical protein
MREKKGTITENYNESNDIKGKAEETEARLG